MLNKLKKLWILLLVGFGFTTAQVNEEILSEFDLMAEMANRDIRSAIFDGVIPADIAITSFGTYGFSEGEKKYFQEVMNRIFYSDVSFKLVSIPESQAVQVEEVEDKLIIKKGASKNVDLKNYATSINSKHYGEIYIYSMTTSIYMKILVHNADTGDVVWSESWVVKRDSRRTIEVGYTFGYSLAGGDIYHYIHSFFGSRAVGLGEFGLSVDLGIYHDAGLIQASQQPGFNLATDLGDVGVSLLFSPKVSLNILEIIKTSYKGVDVYAIVKPGLRVNALVSTDQAGSGDPLFRPQFSFAGNVGLGLGLKKINLDLLFDANPASGLVASMSIYYKF